MTGSPHPRDISASDLDAMLARCRYKAELLELVKSGRENLGFFPAHNPRTLEYPWVLANLPSELAGMTILDVGAGLNPLPFVLASRGARVTTLDSHPTVRDPEKRAEWNEWGFLDYSLLDPRIASVHLPYEEWLDAPRFDWVYCVSVIEHLPAEIRRRWVKRFAAQTSNLLLTVDLIPGTLDLWNMSEGLVVEAPSVHGSLKSLVSELERERFRVSKPVVERAIPDSRVDIALLSAKKR